MPNIKIGEFDDIPYTPDGKPLYTRTISMDAYHYGSNDNDTFVQYNTHNLFATQETMATAEYLKGPGDNKKKPFIISRDSFVGHGQYGSIWTGDNVASVEDLKLSINQIMLFNIFGIPFVGADICGFANNTTPELCARWAQVGAFYPFMRNHYAHEKNPQEFYTFQDPYKSGMKKSLVQRYTFIKYMYTVLYQSSRDGTPTIRHMMYDNPDIEEIVQNEDSFMFGKHLRVTANFDITANANEFSSHFAQGIWVDFNTYERIVITEKVKEINLDNGWDHTNIHIRGGAVVPFQDASEDSGVKTTADLLTADLSLLIVPDESGYAQGDIFLANGELIQEPYQYMTVTFAKKVIQFKFNDGDPDLGYKLDRIHIVSDIPPYDFVCAMDKDQNPFDLAFFMAEHPVSGNHYLVVQHFNEHPFILSNLLSISFGKTGEDFNYCDKSYNATLDRSSQTELSYKLYSYLDPNKESNIKVTATLISDTTVEVAITDVAGNSFTVPKEALNSQFKQEDITRDIADFVTVNLDKFTLAVHEFKNPDSVYFRIDDDSLVFTDYYQSLDTQVNTNGYLYGIGERVTDFFIKEGIYTTWSRDIPDPIETRKWPGNNVYGTHPVYFTKSKSGGMHNWAMMNLNANAQDTKVNYTGELGGQISHYMTGQGIFDMYFFLDHSTPESVVKDYHKLIGFPLLPPFFSIGWNQCRYGYTSTDNLKEVYENYTAADFPMDTLWSDIDYMHKYRDFTFDNNGSYAGLDSFVKDTLHANDKHYVPIIDAGVAIVKDGTYPSYNTGVDKGVYIMSGNSEGNDAESDILFGKVWPGYSAFPDFTSDITNQWWVDELNEFYSKLNFDGLWLDMNEAANFCSGPCVDKDIVPKEKSVLSKLTYSPGANKIEDKSLSIDGKHSDGQIELNYHSLFGFMQGIPSHKFFSDKNERAFIISRSTFVGQGKYTSHWLGDNFADFEYLKYSIPGIMNMNIFGINFVGADICGFIGDTTDNLCQKWTTVGAFYPFARNHNAIGNRDQEPYRFSKEIQSTMRNAIRWRYALLRYYYTQMYINSIEGGTFWKPLFFEFPNVTETYENIDRNVMIGPAIKFSPMIDKEDSKTQNFIFPEGIW